LTIIVEAKPDLKIDPNCLSHSGETKTIALRCPEAAWRDNLDGPLALTSANRSGEKDCVSYAAALAELGQEIDGGLETDIPLSGLPSTIVSVVKNDVKILRQGTLEISP
jgi:tRNA A37 threonylcarbamoyladenosine synthetase subunit TsaC/SUA5/YrdC